MLVNNNNNNKLFKNILSFFAQQNYHNQALLSVEESESIHCYLATLVEAVSVAQILNCVHLA